MAGKMFNLRMEEELRSAIEDQREADGVAKTSMWAREALAGVVELGGLTALAEALEVKRNGNGQPMASPHSPRALALQGSVKEVIQTDECSHPKTAERKLPYAVVCGVCGVKIR